MLNIDIFNNNINNNNINNNNINNNNDIKKVDKVVDNDNDDSKLQDSVLSQDQSVIFAVRASWVVNIFLLIVKIICFIISGSKSVLAALADSVVDLLSQIILSLGMKIVMLSSFS